jgi:hypothetical protein
MVHLVIASFGFKLVISNTLKANDLKVLDILTPAQFEDDDGPFEDGCEMDDKNAMIAKYAATPALALLVDDSETNIHAAQMAGHLVYKVDPDTGLTESDVDVIVSIVQKHGVTHVFIDADQTIFKEHVTSDYIYDWDEEHHDGGNGFDCSKIVLSPGTVKLFKALA